MSVSQTVNGHVSSFRSIAQLFDLVQRPVRRRLPSSFLIAGQSLPFPIYHPVNIISDHGTGMSLISCPFPLVSLLICSQNRRGRT